MILIEHTVLPFTLHNSYLDALLSTALVSLLALQLDKYLGEPKAYHPLIGFGQMATTVESYLNKWALKPICKTQKMRGVLAWALIVLPLPLLLLAYIVFVAPLLPWTVNLGVEVCVVYLALGLTSLKEHAMQVFTPLQQGDLKTARHFTGYLVSRKTTELTPNEMARATTESILENGHDAVIATLVWYSLGGIPAVVLHRLANTLDAMWGYRTPRFNDFGWCAARIDDGLGFMSAKVCTLLYALQAPRLFIKSVINATQQGARYKSYNGGQVMAAGATVLKITLGGNAIYHNQQHTSPTLGQGHPVSPNDIPRSVALVFKAAYAWCVFLCVLFLFTYLITAGA